MRVLAVLLAFGIVFSICGVGVFIAVDTLALAEPNFDAEVGEGDVTTVSASQARVNPFASADGTTKNVDGMMGVVSGNWPPRKGEAYPDIVLKDQHGERVRLSVF